MANKIFKGLPSKAYTEKGFWKKECNTVFVDSWVFVGFAHELKNIGDVIPITVAKQPIILVKKSKDEIVAYHNVCSHRGYKILKKKM